MLYLVAGILKSGMESQLQEHAADFNEHLAQPFRRIRLASVLRNEKRTPTGYVAVIEAQDFADAESYMQQSPFYRAGLYERIDIAEFDILSGGIK